jgi:phosphoribosylcarboxyaminoimidazole (NCAIR) mutase
MILACIPVATVAINNSTNAALLALRIVGIKRPEIQDAMQGYLKSLEQEVGRKIDKIESVGWREYLNEKVGKETRSLYKP